MVVGANGLCHAILESIQRGKQNVERGFLILGLDTYFQVMRGDPKGVIFYKIDPSWNKILRETYFLIFGEKWNL